MPRARKKRGSSSKATASRSGSPRLALPLEPVVPHLAALLREVIATKKQDLHARGIIFWASWTFPLVCREARRLSKIDGLTWLWFFERHVQKQFLGHDHEDIRICDYLPPWFNVQTEVAKSMRAHECELYHRYKIEQTNHVERRCDMARRCATGCLFPHHKDLMLNQAHPSNAFEMGIRACMGNPKDYQAPDLDPLVPMPVVQFVGFLRWWLDSSLLRDQHGHLYNLSCSARGCTRPASVRAPRTPAESEHLDAPGYWPLVRCGVQTLRTDSQWPCNLLWCCKACEEAGTAEFFKRVHCCSEEELAAPPRPTRYSQQRIAGDRVPPARLLMAALERNALVARRMRNEAKRSDERLNHFPLNGEALGWYHEMVVDALNVDVGILYAATHLSSWSPCQRPARQLPNTANWRDTVHFYVRAICNVRRIYIRVISANRDPAMPRTVADLHTDPNTPPKWMLAIHDELLDIF